MNRPCAGPPAPGPAQAPTLPDGIDVDVGPHGEPKPRGTGGPGEATGNRGVAHLGGEGRCSSGRTVQPRRAFMPPGEPNRTSPAEPDHAATPVFRQ